MTKLGGSGVGAPLFALTLLTLSACGSGEERVCPHCVAARGGESSDFGQFAAPTPCQLSETGTAVDAAAARQLGFSDTLGRFTRSFTSPFTWTADPVSAGAPAEGYRSPTSVAIETRVAELEHRIPGLDGCEDSLQVTLDVSFATSDGALSVAGRAVTATGRTPAGSAFAFGRLDLTTAHGSLRLFPPDSLTPRVGFLAVLLHFWPDTVRGGVYVELVGAGSKDSDTGSSYRPLDGQFPVDECSYDVRPRDVGEPSPVLSGKSVIDLRGELMAQLQAHQPWAGSWTDGTPTTVTAELGAPISSCEQSDAIGYTLPLRIRTGDGRVNIDHKAQAFARVDGAGALSAAWFDIYESEPVSSDDFAMQSGISGVDLRGLSGARWHADLFLLDPAEAPHGEVGVEGITSERFVTGVTDALTWQLE